MKSGAKFSRGRDAAQGANTTFSEKLQRSKRKVVQNLSGVLLHFSRSFSVARKSVFVEIAQTAERSLYTAEATGSMPVLDIPLLRKVEQKTLLGKVEQKLLGCSQRLQYKKHL